MKIAILRETAANEARVAATPETVQKYIGLGAKVSVEKGAGDGSKILDADYKAAGATVSASASAAIKGADVVLTVRRPDAKALAGAKKKARWSLVRWTRLVTKKTLRHSQKLALMFSRWSSCLGLPERR